MRILTFALVAVIASSLPAVSVAGEDAPPTKLGSAPELTLETIYGKEFPIKYADHKVTLINFWAVWCVPCHEEMPQIADLFTRFKDRGFSAIGIAVESGDAEEVRSFLGENPELGINYPIVMGTFDALLDFGNIEVVPTTLLVDGEGKIVKSYIGVHPGFGERLAQDIGGLLAGPQAAGAEKPGAASSGENP